MTMTDRPFHERPTMITVSPLAQLRPQECPTMPALEPMIGINEIARLLACSRRLVERMRSAGKLPKPDLHVGRMPRWNRKTIAAWIARGGVS